MSVNENTTTDSIDAGQVHGLDPVVESELAARRTKVDKIRYVCQRLGTPTTAEVLAMLVTYGVVADPKKDRPAVSKILNKYRREEGLAQTGDLPKLDDDMLAQMDVEYTRAQDEQTRAHAITVTSADASAPHRTEDTRGSEATALTATAPDTQPSLSTPTQHTDRHQATTVFTHDQGQDHVHGTAPDGGERPRRAARPRGWFVAWLSFVFGGVVSVAANVAHTLYPTPGQLEAWVKAGHKADAWAPPVGAMLFSAFWPIALILAVEVLTRAAWRRGFLYGLARYGGTTLVAAVAAVMSYRHMSGLLAIWGEDSFGAHLGPLAVDGLMVVAAAALLSMSRTAKEQTAPTPA